MNKQYEIIEFDNDTPIRLKSAYVETLDSHWHKGIELILVLNGKVRVVCDGNSYNLAEDDLILINKHSIHSLSSENGCNLVSLQINTAIIENKKLYFNCNSAIDNNKGRYYNLKRIIAELVKINSSHNDYNKYFNFYATYRIFYELCKNFPSNRDGDEPESRKYFERLNSIIEYIDEHYRENITLARLAEHEHLSVPYLSAFFEKHLGINFLTYYNELRLGRAVNELLSSDRSVEDISIDNGFSDPRSFVNLFKKKYGELPSAYRKARAAKPKDIGPDAKLTEFGGSESNLQILAKYLPEYNQNANAPDVIPSTKKVVHRENISVAETHGALRHTFKTFTSVARAKELLFGDVQQMLREIQRDIGYEYINFHGLLSDDMLVYSEDEKGNPRYSFVLIDKIIDFLISVNLKPMITFSFMPKALALYPENTVYASPFCISPPKDMNKWRALISALTQHLIERYGKRAVRSWVFSVWNEPDTSTTMFGFENNLDFYELYKVTYETVKSVDKKIVFGSPSVLVSYNVNRQWIRGFIEWCKRHECIPDFLSIHFYDNDFSDESLPTHRPAHPAHERLNMDENSFSECIGITKQMFAELELSDIPIYLTEWNLTVSHRNLLNDTCFKSCYLAKNLLKNYDELDSFGYWTLTDFIEETQPSPEQFHGGLGIFTQDGIKKPHYHMFEFVNKLGNKIIEQGDGYFITKSHNAVQIILYNYEHFNHLFASGERFDMTFTKRYTPFSQLGKMHVSLTLSDIPFDECTVVEHILNQNHGSAFDEWVRMGAPKLNDYTVNYLKHISCPKLIIHTDKTDDGKLEINADLEPLEVRLLEITYNNP
ncbi:MAG: helix-turn-helix domain-containing protein [Clostridiales bacterium]|nr:helix-turn-helix domain-containing protein [Clostridiales bacterium]